MAEAVEQYRPLNIQREDCETPPDWFHDGQLEAWNAFNNANRILILAGTRSGKTVTLPYFLKRMIARQARLLPKFGEGVFLAVSPTFSLGERKFFPELIKFFCPRYGTYKVSPIRKIELHRHGLAMLTGQTRYPVSIQFGYAENPNTLESVDALGVVSDESGQPEYKLGSYEALDRRLLLSDGGHHIIATTPYSGAEWIKTRLVDSGAPYIRVINYKSIDNPTFSQEEWLKQKAVMPDWKFRMFYEGQYTRPAGAIYDCYDDDLNSVEPFVIPKGWRRIIAIDFGQINMAAIFMALDPSTDIAYCYRTYHPGKSKSVAEHVASMLSREDDLPLAVGGSGSEENWREAFAVSGLPIGEPYIKNDVERGISAVYGLFKSGKLKIFNTLPSLIHAVKTYSRELDDNDVPTIKIRDKQNAHLCDALRYGATELESTRGIKYGQIYAENHR